MRSRRITTYFIVLFLFAPHTLNATVKVLKASKKSELVALSADGSMALQLNEYVCLTRPPTNEVAACGRIIRTSDKGIILALEEETSELKVGETLELEKNARVPTSETTSSLNIVDTTFEERYQWRNVAVGFNLLSLNLRLEQMVVRWGALGLMPSFILNQSAGNAGLSGYGAFVTGSIYPDGKVDGFWMLNGIGGFSLNAKTDAGEERGLAAAILSTVGWRWRWPSGLNVGVAAGAQYTLLPNFKTITLDYGGISPSLVLEIAYSF